MTIELIALVEASFAIVMIIYITYLKYTRGQYK